MEKIKLAYSYIYYTLYKAAQKSSTIFPHRFIAVLSLDIILSFLLFSFMFYYSGLTSIIFDISDTYFLLFGFFLIVVPNYIIFDYKDKYKDYIIFFDKLPLKTNSKRQIFTWCAIVLVIFNFIFSLFYANEKAKENHIGRYSTEYFNFDKSQQEDSN